MNQEILLKQMSNGRFSHAYLLHGEDENGKRKTIDGIIRNLKITPSDTHFLEKMEGDQGIKIEAIRALRRTIQLKPHSSPYKLAAIFSGEDLTSEASNALLKTLEEPPAHSLIFLTVKNPKNVLSTINSRCQKVYVYPSEKNRQSSANDIIFPLEDATIREKFQFAEKLSKKDKSDTERFVKETIERLRREMLTAKEKDIQLQWSELTDKGLTYFNLLKTNVNARLLLENFMLEII